jgi:O-antigen/teichoic acid export membrane protein
LLDHHPLKSICSFALENEYPTMALRKNIFANFLGRGYQAGAIYLFAPLYVHILGSEAFGLIAIQSILFTFCSLLDVGLSSAFTREVAKGDKNTNLASLLKTIERILLLTSVFVALIVVCNAKWIASNWLNTSEKPSLNEIHTCIQLMGLTVPFQILISLYTAGLIGYQKQVLANTLAVVGTTLRSGIVIPLIYIIPEIEVFFFWQMAMTIFSMILFRFGLMKVMSLKWISEAGFSIGEIRPLMRFTGGMLAITIISSINTQLDKVIVSKIFSVGDLGRYALASSLAQLPVILSAPVLVAAYPRITELIAQGDRREGDRVYESVSFFVASLSSVAAVALLLFTPAVLAVWLGPTMLSEELLNTTRILTFGGLFLALASTPFYLGLANQHNRTSIVLGIFTTVAIGPVILFGARNHGLAGAALAWPLLNAAALIALSSVIHSRFYSGRRRRWWVFFTLIPLVTSVISILPFKLISLEINSSPAFECLLAGFGAALAMLILSRLSRRIIAEK